MADEIKKVITIEVGQATASLQDVKDKTDEASQSFNSLKDYKKHIDKLTASLVDLEEGSEKYNDTVKQVQAAQNKLNQIVSDAKTSSKAAEGSYNALQQQMNALKKQWKETSDEAERADLGKQIVKINDKLKDMDGSIGNYQRNVGNYASAFASISPAAGTAVNAVKGLSGAFKALIANPVGAIIMAIVSAVKLLKSGFENSESASNKLKQAFSALQPIIDAVKNVITNVAEAFGDLALKVVPKVTSAISGVMQFFEKSVIKAKNMWAKVKKFFGAISDEELQQTLADNEAELKAIEEKYAKQEDLMQEAAAKRQDIAKREQQLVKDRRRFLVNEAKTEAEVSELKAKAADKEKYTDEERAKFLSEAIEKEKKINDTKLALAQREYQLAKDKAALTANDAAANDALAQAEANLYKVKKEYNDKSRELITQLNEANKSAKTEEVKTDAEVVKQKEKDAAEIEKIQKRVAKSQLTTSEQTIATLTEQYEKEKELLEKYGEDTTGLTEEFKKNIAMAKAGAVEDKSKKVDDTASTDRDIADKTIVNAHERAMKLLEIERNRLDQKKLLIEEELAIDNLPLEKKQELAQKLAEVDASIVENSRQVTEEQKANVADLINTYSSVGSTISGMIDSIAGFWQDSIKQREEAGEISKEQAEKEFENSKKLQIASAVINGLAGIATAISTAMTLGPIAGPIVGAVNSAMVATTMAIQIAKIKQQKLDSGGSAAASAVSASSASPSNTATAYTPQYTTNVTGQSETVDLENAVASGTKAGTQDIRVYVVEDDIRQAGNRADVRETEATF